jgi:hypothetical protein
MRITVVGAVVIAMAVIGAVLLIRHFNNLNNQGPTQNPA